MHNTVCDTLKELNKTDINGDVEWKKRFMYYATQIDINKDKITQAAGKFHNWHPFEPYLILSEAVNSSDKYMFSLRYLGQAVADLIVDLDSENVEINTDKYYEATKKYFKHGISAHGDWKKGKEAKEFRKAFADLFEKGDIKTHSQEHKYESLLLGCFSMKKKEFFKGIKPIKICKARFPMKTPLLASDKNGVALEKKPAKGGGIDILTRARHGSNVRINVMELKDEYKSSEPPEKVIRQAIKYAVFIQQLLRSESGEMWWKLFGFKSKLPDKLVIDATCVMPDINNNSTGNSEDKINDTSFALKRISIDGNDEIELHYIFFKTKKVNGQICIADVMSSLS